MAEADCKPTSTTWITLQATYPLVMEICHSFSLAGPWLAEQIAAGRVRVRWRAVRPADAAVEGFWQGSPPTIEFANNSATK